MLYVTQLDFFVLPLLNGVGNDACLFVSIGLMRVGDGELFQRIVNGFRLGVRVGMGHKQGLSSAICHRPQAVQTQIIAAVQQTNSSSAAMANQ